MACRSILCFDMHEIIKTLKLHYQHQMPIENYKKIKNETLMKNIKKTRVLFTINISFSITIYTYEKYQFMVLFACFIN